MGIPFLMNFLGTITNLQQNGNNYGNFFILYLERIGPWGLYRWFNLFNLGGWIEAFNFVIYMIFFWWLEPFVIIVSLVDGSLKM